MFGDFGGHTSIQRSPPRCFTSMLSRLSASGTPTHRAGGTDRGDVFRDFLWDLRNELLLQCCERIRIRRRGAGVAASDRVS